MARTKYGLKNGTPKSTRSTPTVKVTKQSRKEVSGSPIESPAATGSPQASRASPLFQRKNRAEFDIQKCTFQRLVKEIICELMDQKASPLKMQAVALGALQEASETYLVNLFAQANSCALHAKRITVYPKDLALVRRLRGETDPSGNTRLATQSPAQDLTQSTQTENQHASPSLNPSPSASASPSVAPSASPSPAFP